MKHLSLQQAMLGMRIVQTDHGMIIKSPAGSAEYNLKGRRIKVSGYPEYFPGQLRVKDKRMKTGGRMEISGGGITAYGKDGSVSARIGRKLVDATANWSMKIKTEENGRRYAAGVGIAVNNEATKIRLTDDMREAVIDAIRESDVCKALQASQDALASAQVTTQLINQAVSDAIRNAVKPGGLIHRYCR